MSDLLKVVKMTPSPSQLEIVTSGQKLHCPVDGCAYVAVNSSMLGLHKAKAHKLVKNVEKGCVYQYHCPVSSCPWNPLSTRFFKSLDILRTHYNKVHSEKKFSCPKCKKQFGLERDLGRHERECGQTFTCPDCEKNYTSWEALKMHCVYQRHRKPEKPASLISVRPKVKPVEKPKITAKEKTSPPSKDNGKRTRVDKPLFILPKPSAQNASVQTEPRGNGVAQAVQTDRSKLKRKSMAIQTANKHRRKKKDVLSTGIQTPTSRPRVKENVCLSTGIQTSIKRKVNKITPRLSTAMQTETLTEDGPWCCAQTQTKESILQAAMTSAGIPRQCNKQEISTQQSFDGFTKPANRVFPIGDWNLYESGKGNACSPGQFKDCSIQFSPAIPSGSLCKISSGSLQSSVALQANFTDSGLKLETQTQTLAFLCNNQTQTFLPLDHRSSSETQTMPLLNYQSHTQTQTLSPLHSQSHTQTQTLSPFDNQSHTQTQTLSLFDNQSHTQTQTLSPFDNQSHTQTQTMSPFDHQIQTLSPSGDQSYTKTQIPSPFDGQSHIQTQTSLPLDGQAHIQTQTLLPFGDQPNSPKLSTVSAQTHLTACPPFAINIQQTHSLSQPTSPFTVSPQQSFSLLTANSQLVTDSIWHLDAQALDSANWDMGTQTLTANWDTGTQTFCDTNWDTGTQTLDDTNWEMGTQTLNDTNWEMGTQTLDDTNWDMGTQTLDNASWGIGMPTIDGVRWDMDTGTQTLEDFNWDMGTQTLPADWGLDKQGLDNPNWDMGTQTLHADWGSDNPYWDMGTQTLPADWGLDNPNWDMGTQTMEDLVSDMMTQTGDDLLDFLTSDSQTQTTMQTQNSSMETQTCMDVTVHNWHNMSSRQTHRDLTLLQNTSSSSSQTHADLTQLVQNTSTSCQTHADLRLLQNTSSQTHADLTLLQNTSSQTHVDLTLLQNTSSQTHADLTLSQNTSSQTNICDTSSRGNCKEFSSSDTFLSVEKSCQTHLSPADPMLAVFGPGLLEVSGQLVNKDTTASQTHGEEGESPEALSQSLVVKERPWENQDTQTQTFDLGSLYDYDDLGNW